MPNKVPVVNVILSITLFSSKARRDSVTTPRRGSAPTPGLNRGLGGH